MSIPRIDPNFTSEDLRRAADKFMDAGYEYWEACHKSGIIGGALIWVTDASGRMAMFTRGEYRHVLLKNVDEIGQTTYAFGGVADR